MAKIKFGIEDLYLYKCGNLWNFKYDLDIGLSALRMMINNQEDIYRERVENFEELRKESLSNIPAEWKSSYDQQFYEFDGMALKELIRIQRNSACLSIYAFIENRLVELLNISSNELQKKIVIPKQSVIPGIKNILEKDIGIEGNELKKEFGTLINQISTRNAIAHDDSYIKTKRTFHKMKGLELDDLKIVISNVEYLHNLILKASDLFDKLLVALDKKLTKREN